MTGSPQAPGFFGKLPSHGDFLARRLPPALRLCLDDWLQGALLQSRIDLGQAWMPTWLGSPLWRFVMGPGVCGAQAWTGVMMPSHDRVGRCFPLLVAAAVEATPLLRDCMTVHDGWFARIEDLALSALETGFSLEAFDAALTAQGGVPAASRIAADRAAPCAAMDKRLVETFSAGKLPALAGETLSAGQSAWWTDGSQQVLPCMARCPGLPPARAFAALLDGRWAERGWG